ncbi:Protein sof1 [Coemansia sp. RSA 1822]|nr:Protein sof1 [Coemansia sp. RSA 638]KAJ2123543.1 Protein sof1 [Coemansia sp. RSA 720]KAJ2541114.1 Protein sof1 [Coemansia sp. RSA 1853]KAJ2564105.1 Protein sof1 [Coemansia sp. RSA 1822]
MKVKALSRSTADYTRETKSDIQRLPRNVDPALHPLERAREYKRALNAAKVERMLAKPFLASLTGHIDGIYSMAKNPWDLDQVITGSGDGELRMWSLESQETAWRAPEAHRGIVRGVCSIPGGATDRFLSAGADKLVKVWSRSEGALANDGTPEAVATYSGKHAFSAVDHHRSRPLFATGSSQVEVWDVDRSEPIANMTWGADTINSVRMNQTEVNVLASSGTDRSVVLYDLRTSSALAKVVLKLSTNAIAWNPMEAFMFAVANEDHNVYTFDMRRMDHAVNVLRDHVSAVMDVDYSPTGHELVSGSYDRTVRLWDVARGHSRDIYHSKRMQRVFCVRYTQDNAYVLSGSDDSNLRLWRARASERMGAKSNRQRATIEYADKLKDRFKHVPEVRRVLRQRNVPTAIKRASNTKHEMLASRKRKEENERKSAKPGTKPRIPERQKPILGTTSK